MTTIRCAIDGETLSLEIDGHATGCQEACSGISALVEALGTYVVRADDGHAKKVLDMSLEPGRCLFRVIGDSTMAEVWRVVCIGLIQISMAYPDAVSVVWSGQI